MGMKCESKFPSRGVTGFAEFPPKTVIPRSGHFHEHQKKPHETYSFFHKTLTSLFSLIVYQKIYSKTATFVQNNKLFTS